MKIAFLCTSLAPGRDGVGDYVRQLAGACEARGHECLLVALNDRALIGLAEERSAGELRLPAVLDWTSRTAALVSALREFNPDWLSWQIVPYGFHHKGILPAGIFPLLDSIRPWRSQVTLHELWVGVARGDNLYLRATGLLQRRRLLTFLRRARPACIHTTNSAYQLILAQHGWPSDLLPLCGNLPVLPRSPHDSPQALAEFAGAGSLPEPCWIGVLFGTIHPQWRPAPTLRWLRTTADRHGRHLILLAVGRAGTHGDRLLEELPRTSPEIRIVAAGSQPAEKISRILHAVDFGIATHPWGLIEKSGTTATLLEHGLPVLVPRDDWHLRRGEIASARDPLLRRLGDLDPDAFPAWLKERREPAARRHVVAASFLGHLSASVSGGAFVA